MDYRSMFKKTFYNDDVDIVEIKQSGGYTRQSIEKKLCSIKADVQSYSGNLAEKQYGLVIECQKRMYFDECADVKEGNYVVYRGDTYKIVYVVNDTMGGTAILRLVKQ